MSTRTPYSVRTLDRTPVNSHSAQTVTGSPFSSQQASRRCELYREPRCFRGILAAEKASDNATPVGSGRKRPTLTSMCSEVQQRKSWLGSREYPLLARSWWTVASVISLLLQHLCWKVYSTSSSLKKFSVTLMKLVGLNYFQSQKYNFNFL